MNQYVPVIVEIDGISVAISTAVVITLPGFRHYCSI
jgi:hypothetical protein